MQAIAAKSCLIASFPLCRLALCVQVYLKMDRVDKAEHQVKVGAMELTVS